MNTFSVITVPISGISLRLEKKYSGELSAIGNGTMLAIMHENQGGYVAMEEISGRLNGKTGSFFLQHYGVMDIEEETLNLKIVPGSGKGEFAGISGQMTFSKSGDVYYYTIDYIIGE